MAPHKFNIIFTEEPQWLGEFQLVRTELGFEFLDNDGRAIIRAWNLNTTGNFYVYLNDNINNNKYEVVMEEEFETKQFSEEDTISKAYHFRIKEKEK